MRIKLILLILYVFSAYSTYAQAHEKKALFIIVDGISSDVIEKINTPNLDEIAKVGGYTHAYVGGEKGAYSETPTISAVGYNSLLTGTWVNKHNVWGNDIKAPNYQYWSLFRFLEEQYPEKETAIFSTWLDNRTKLVGEGLEATGNVELDYAFDGFEHDTVQFPHGDDRKFIHLIDEHVTNEAARYVKANGPDLSWVYLEYTDDMGHMFGDSEQMYEAVEIADDQIGRIWDAIQYREENYEEDWLIVITTDHGRDAESGKHHGGQSDRERSIWITTNAKNLNDYFYNEVPGVVSIFPTIARHMKLNIPKAQAMEIDGIPLIGGVSVIHPNAKLENNEIKLSWEALKKNGKVKVWLSTTNHFKEGKKDKYQMVGEVPLKKEKYSFDVSEKPSSFYKIVLEGPHNFVNHWIFLEENQQN